MKNIFYIILITQFFLGINFNIPSAFCQLTDLDKMGLKDSVKSIRIITHSVSDDVNTGNDEKVVSDQLSMYNIYGNEIEKHIYKDGKLFSKIIFEYDENNHKRSLKDFTANGEPYLTVSYTTDQKGYITEALWDRSLQRLYDDERNPIDVEFEKIYQNLYTKVTYKNSYNGKVLTEEYFKPDGSKSGKYAFTYDHKGHKKTSAYYNSKGVSTSDKKYYYNSKGLAETCKLKIRHRLAMTSNFKYIYDEKGNWIKRIENKYIIESIYTQDFDDGTIITYREIAYY